MASTIKVDQIEGSTGSTITVPTGQTFTIVDGLGVAGGGTGLSSFTAGDVLYATGSTTLAKLAKGTAEQVLAMNSGATAPDWGSVDLTVLPTITAVKGGTGQTSFTAGDIFYANSTTTIAKLGVGSGEDTLKLNAGATAPEWVTVAAGSSDYVKLSTVSALATATSVSIDGFFSSTYETYVVYFENLCLSAEGYIRMRFNVGGSAVTTSTYQSSNVYGSINSAGATSVGAYTGGWLGTDMQIGNDQTNTSAKATNGTFFINDPLNTSYQKIMQGSLYQLGNGSDTYNWSQWFGGTNTGTSAISGVTIYGSAGGNFVNPTTWRIYGIK